MIVDDEIDLAKMYSTYLETCGFNSVYFADPLMALEHFKENHDLYSIIITDLRMPGMNGIELAKKIRDIGVNPKIILITAFYTSDLQYNHTVTKTLFLDIIQKPVRLSMLKQRITELILK